MTRRAARFWLPVVLALAVAGCVQLPARTEATRIVAPEVRLAPDPAWPTVPWSLVVQRPIADQTRGSVRVVVRTAHSRLAFYPGIAWLDEMPDMLQSVLVEGFVDSGRIASVARPGTALARIQLVTDVRRFDLVEGPGGLAVDLVLQAALVEVRSGRMLASRVFDAAAAATSADVDAATVAFETALAMLVRDLVGWSLQVVPAQAE